jgi:hypothetical protein
LPGLLASGSTYSPAFPSFQTVALAFVPRYSGGAAPDLNRVPF